MTNTSKIGVVTELICFITHVRMSYTMMNDLCVCVCVIMYSAETLPKRLNIIYKEVYQRKRGWVNSRSGGGGRGGGDGGGRGGGGGLPLVSTNQSLLAPQQRWGRQSGGGGGASCLCLC